MPVSPSPHTDAACSPRRHPAADRWNDDWERFARSPAAADALRRWGTEDPLLAATDLTSLLLASGCGRTAADTGADTVLGRLVRRAAGDHAAARTVLQRVLPGLISVAQRRAGADRAAIRPLLDELLATAWTVIVTYPVERRPAKFAVNIVRDAEYLTFVRARRLRRVIEELSGEAHAGRRVPSCGADGRRETDTVNASETVDRMLANAQHAGLGADDLRLLRSLYVDGRRVDEVAAEHEVGARALRYRRANAVSRLARLVAA